MMGGMEVVTVQQKSATSTPWAVVLAGGSGNRLRHLTTDARGVSVPKQYCSLNGGASLFELAMRRAEQVVARRSITAIVAQQHQQWWNESLADMSPDNLIVQPSNRGTGLGILLSALSILEQDPDARIVFLPSDHYVANEYILAAATRNALDLANRFDHDIVMIGITPESADPELGYIVPRQCASGGVFDVARFVEKPQCSVAHQLVERAATGTVSSSRRRAAICCRCSRRCIRTKLRICAAHCVPIATTAATRPSCALRTTP